MKITTKKTSKPADVVAPPPPRVAAPKPDSLEELHRRAKEVRNRIGLILFAVRGLENEDGGPPLSRMHWMTSSRWAAI